MQRDLADKQRRAAAAAAAPAQGAGASGGSAGTVGASGSGRRDASWLMPGIIVKVVSKALKEAGYYKSKVCV
jgi:KN17 SH3-like C-terminal domain